MGLCGLCRQPGELQESHLLPRAGYKHLRGSKAGVQWDPVFTTPKKARITTDQVTAPFLCSHCEQRFHKKGEDPNGIKLSPKQSQNREVVEL
jgi:5-methylcytosine-specific restriction endonuclease McrA